VALLILTIIFTIATSNISVSITINGANCGASSSSSSPSTCASPTCSFCLNNCSDFCLDNCNCTETKCYQNLTRYQLNAQLFCAENNTAAGYIEILLFDYGDCIRLNGTLFTYNTFSFESGSLTFGKLGQQGILQGLSIMNIVPNGGVSSFFCPVNMADGYYNYTTITRDQFDYIVGGLTTVYFTSCGQLYGTLILYRSTPSGINVSPYILRQSCDCVSNAVTKCDNTGIYLGMEASEDCASGLARALCYNSSLKPAIYAQFTPCTCSNATAACQQLFPACSNVTCVFESSIGCLSQNLNPATRYLCVVPS